MKILISEGVELTIGSGVKIENYAACMLILTSEKLILL